MIRAALFNSENSRKYIDFDAVPLSGESGYRCYPEGVVSRDTARRIADELASGRMSGWVQGFWWYRQASSRLESACTSGRAKYDPDVGDPARQPVSLSSTTAA